MKVICIRPSSKLLKNHVYECDFYNTQINQWKTNRSANTSKTYYNNRLHIVGFGWYGTNSFTKEDGTIIPLNGLYDARPKVKTVGEEILKAGDIVVCNTNRYKNFIKGNKYKVTEVIISKFRKKIKIEGYNRLLTYNCNFKKLGEQESRDIYLNSVLNGVEIKTEIGIKGVENKDKLLLEILSKSILDVNRHDLSIVDWAIEKHSKCGLIREDFESLLSKSLSEIIESIK